MRREETRSEIKGGMGQVKEARRTLEEREKETKGESEREKATGRKTGEEEKKGWKR